jgi:hypothetical protein
MTKSEELVYSLCTKSFLSLWSYPNPRGKKGKELCDILVVCEPDIIIFSVKEVAFKDTGDRVGWERWRRAAIEESCSQITGAERWIEANPNVVTKDGEPGLPFPGSNRVVHRIAVALGSRGEVPMTFGDSGKGFIHVFDEQSLNTLMEELDTISDFVKYLADKEAFYRAGKLTLFDGGGEEDLLALYLVSGQRFPEEPDLIVLDDNLWETFKEDPDFQAKQELDKVSYIWDEIIEEVHQTYLDSNFITDLPYASEFTDLENAMRVMARENRFSRRLIADSLVDFLENSEERKSKSRVCDSPAIDARYVFLIADYDSSRKANMGELVGRCIVARGLNQTKKSHRSTRRVF